MNKILEDDQGCFWLSTNKGIIAFNPGTETVEQHYTKADGLQADKFFANSGVRTRHGELWFGGNNGVNRFRPDRLLSNDAIPPVVLTSLTQGGGKVNWDNHKAAHKLTQITLDWQNPFFEFEYAALNFTAPEKNQYKYKLEGYDSDWYEAGTRRFGRYSGLDEGMYVLKVKGSNNDGIWNQTPAALNIIVKPHLEGKSPGMTQA